MIEPVDWVYGHRHPGIFWLASYPRSGVTMARSVFAKCFGLHTWSLYGEADRGMAYHYTTNPVPRTGDQAMLARLACRQGVLPVKTHEYPRPHEPVPTIVVARDGRRVMSSLQKFYHDKEQLDVSMEDIIRGNHKWGNWSDWIRAWSEVPHAMWITHEQMASDLPAIITALEQRLGLVRVANELLPFGTMHKDEPTFFREGATTGRGHMTDSEEGLFWELHGEAMATLGYER